MSDTRDPDRDQIEDVSAEVPKVYEMEEQTDDVGLPDHDFLGLDPGDANKETEPGDPPVPHGG